jgi:type II secretory pathway component PulM
MTSRVRLDIAVSLVVLIALVVANAAVYRPRQERLDRLSTQIDRTEKDLVYLTMHANDLARISGYLPDAERDQAQGDRSFLAAAGEAVTRLGLRLSKIEPRGEEPYGEYVKRSYRLQLEGDYADFAAFLAYLEALPDVVIVNSFDYRSSEIARSSSHRAALNVTVVGR